MVYGVYAAKSASLSVSGTIGFKAHNAVLKYSDVAVANALDADGAAYSYTGSSTHVDTTTAIAFAKEMYFDDLSGSTATADNIPYITITLKVYNYSKFAVKFTDVTTATALPGSTSGSTVSGVKYTATATYTSGSDMAASTDGNTAGGDCTVTISLIYGDGSDGKTYTGGAANAFTATGFNITLAFAQVTA